MSARDELGKIIWETSHADEQSISATGANIIADAILAAGYTKPRTITTAEELDALPEGTVVLSESYHSDVNGNAISFQRWYDGDWHRGGRSGSTHPDNFLPATVLYEPAP